MSFRSLLLIACVGGCASLVSAAPQQTPAQTPPPVFRAGTNLARIDVRVTDAQGQVITDLRSDEIEIVESGSRRPILLFQRIAESGRSYGESGARTIGSEVSTNLGSPRGQLYLLLFDQMHITPGHEQRAKIAAETFLRRRLRPQDRVAIFGLPGPGPALMFTSSVATAQEELQRVRGQMERIASTPIGEMTQFQAYEIARGNEAEIARQITSISQRMPEIGANANDAIGGRNVPANLVSVRQVLSDAARTVVNQTDAESRRFLSLLTGVLRQVRPIDGQKTLLLFSEGFYADSLAHELNDVVSAAAQSYAVVYAFDLNHSTSTLGPTSSSGPQSTETASRLEPLSHLAHETNGALMVDALGNIDASLEKLTETNADFYMVGFASASSGGDTDYRRLDVRVTRPGARVSTRTGYVVNTATTASERRRALDDALTAPFGQQGLRVEYTTYLSRLDPSDVARVALSLETELPVAMDASDAADVVFVVRDSETAQIAASGSDRIPLPASPMPGLAVGRGTWRMQFALPPGSYIMRCVVREPGGLIGSADRRFQVRSLSGPDPATSDLLVSRPNAPLPVRARAYTGSPFSGAVRVYGRVTDDLASVTGTLELVPADGRAAALSVRGALSDLHVTPTGASRELIFPIPLDGLPAGDYVARAIVRDAASTIADLRRQVEVVAGAEPPVEPARALPATASLSPTRRAEDVVTGAIARDVIERAAVRPSQALRSAAAQARAGKWADAVTTLNGAPSSDEVGGTLRGLALLALRRFSEAADALAAGMPASDGSRAFLLGWARTGAGDLPGAIEAFRSAVASTPTMVPAHLSLAEALLQRDDTASARQALEDGLRAVPGSPELSDMLARIKR